jgi:carnitine 3-dehydrogenase
MGKAAIIGCGTIGSGWAARFLLNGWDVAVHDPGPATADRLHAVLANARRSLPGLYDRPLPPEGRLTFHGSVAEAVREAEWVQVGEPESLPHLGDALALVAGLAPSTATVATATSRVDAAHPPRWIVARAHDPVYLLPLVELAGDAGACDRAAGALHALGMWPVVSRADARITDRLLQAMAREASALVAGGAMAQDVDDALCMGPGLLMACGGLADVRGHGNAGTEPASAARPDLSGAERLRDDSLVDIIRALRRTRRGAGAVIAAHEATLPLPDHDGLPVTLCRQVPETWTDFNGHMSSHHYLETGSLATDRFMALVGVDAAYIAAGRSYFSVEDHVRYRAEIRAGERITVTTQVLGGDGKRVHLFHFIHRGDGTIAATMETLLIHTDLALRRACPPDPAVERSFAGWVDAHAQLNRPKDAGRAVSRQIG